MPERDLPLLVDAARDAAQIALDYWRSDQRVDAKLGGSPVSEGDFAVDGYLRQRLLEARPDYGWLSEETEDGPERLDRERVFIVDPIDGTRAYVAGEKTWALSLAVAERGRPVAGVVYLPARDRLYAAATGEGATRNGTRLACGGRRAADGATVMAPKASLDPQWWTNGVPALRRAFRPSLAYRFCCVAEGKFDAMLTLRDTWEWDIAAGILIARESGAEVSDRAGGALILNNHTAKTRGILCANPGLHAALLARLV